MARAVAAPDGTVWKVGRKWIPYQPKWRGPRQRGLPGLDFVNPFDFADASGGLGALAAMVLVLGAVAAVVLAIFFVFPAVVLIVEVLVVLLVVAIGVASRVLLRRPWTVEAVSATGERHAWNVVGWRASQVLVDRLATTLARGEHPQRAIVRWSTNPEA